MGRELGWIDVVSFVQEVHAKEGARPNPGFYRLIGNQALNIISAQTGMVSAAWDNGAEGDLTLDGNMCLLPTDCLAVESVEWDGVLLEQKQADELDAECPGWRQAVGANPAYFVVDGTEIVLDCTPVGATDGKLVVRGIGMLSEFPVSSEDPNPLSRLPVNLQLAPAYYILANLPVNVENATEMARQARYQTLWEADLARIESVMGRRKRERFRY